MISHDYARVEIVFSSKINNLGASVLSVKRIFTAHGIAMISVVNRDIAEHVSIIVVTFDRYINSESARQLTSALFASGQISGVEFS